jgi:hypothetical protein
LPHLAFHARVKAENASGRDVQSDGQPRATITFLSNSLTRRTSA